MNAAALGAALVTTALAQALPASAAESPPAAPAGDSEDVSLIYEDSPPADCPTEAAFQAEVTKLTSKAHFTHERLARRIRIELSSRGRDVVGRLITGDGKNQSSREVRGRDCKEVSSALAIAVALTIDPDALLGAGEPSEAKPPEAPAKKPEPAKPPPPPPASLAAPPSKRLELRFGLGLGLTLESAWAPQMRPGGQAFAALGVGDHLRVSLGGTRFITREVDSVSFGAWTANANVSWNIALLGVLRPFASLGYEAGAIEASGSGLSVSVTAQRRWQAASVGLGLRFETDSVFFQLGGSLLVPITRQRYLMSDAEGKVKPLYESASVGLKQETALGVFL